MAETSIVLTDVADGVWLDSWSICGTDGPTLAGSGDWSVSKRTLRGGLSDGVIQPGIPTPNDVSWWYRDRIRELKLTTWFHPSVSIQRAEQPAVDMKTAIAARHDDDVIMPGDLDGYQVALAAHEMRPDLKTLLTSGFTRRREEHANGEGQYLSSLAQILLSKPYDVEELAFAVRRALRGYHG